jgi:ABC-2 type transport system ATP-binding protein
VVEPTPAIEIRGLTKRYGTILALDGLDLDVPRGSILGLLGPSGAGKTTTLRLLAGLARPTGGSATVAGVPVSFEAGLGARREIGLLADDPAFYGWMTGRELLAFVADLVGIKRAALPDRVSAIVERVGLGGVADDRIATYPIGWRRRLGMGQALMGEPDVLLLDEPLAGLEVADRRAIRACIAEVRGAATVVAATRAPSDLDGLCDRVAILDRGRLLFDAPVDVVIGGVAPSYLVEVQPGAGLALAGLVARLRREPWVSEVATADHRLRVSVLDVDRAARELLPAVVATGMAVVAFRRERPNLDDVLRQAIGDRGPHREPVGGGPAGGAGA